MARRITQPSAPRTSSTRNSKSSTSRPSLKEIFSSIQMGVQTYEFRLCSGIILAVITLMLVIAYFSFFFTGGHDYSIVVQPDARQAMRNEIQNALGLPGAVIARWLVDGTFGIVSFAALVALAIYSARLIKYFTLRRLRLLFIVLFILVWGSVTLGFAQQQIGVGSFFRWGGAFGQIVAAWGTSYIQWIGMSLILLATFIIFCIVVDKHFVEHCQQAARWFLSLFKKKETTETEPIEDTESTPIDLIPILTTQDPEFTEETEPTPEIVVDVNTPQEEETIVVQDPEPQDDVDINVADIQEVELTEDDPEYLLRKLGPYDPRKDLEHYKFPSLNLLKVYDNETAPVINQEEQQANANRIVTTLRNFDIEIESIKATVGPTVTLYEIVPKAGIRIAKIQGLENDIMLSLAAIGIRIIAPMPGKGTIGIEVPNEKPQIVSMHSVIASKRFQEEQKMRLPVAIGRTITNEVFTFDLAKTPHLLVAGATGQGKSVGLNAILTSLLYKKHPAELKFVLVDPKMVEFSIYKPLLKHYMAAMPDQNDDDIIITNCQKVINTLNSLVIEMENRYQLLMQAKCRNLDDYNE